MHTRRHKKHERKSHKRIRYYSNPLDGVIDGITDVLVLSFGLVLEKSVLVIFFIVEKLEEGLPILIKAFFETNRSEPYFEGYSWPERGEPSGGRLPGPEHSDIHVEVGDSHTKKYFLTASWLTEAEQKFFALLKRSVGDKYNIVPRVQLSRLIHIHSPSGQSPDWADIGRIDTHTIDFVLFDKQFKPQLAIEMADQPRGSLKGANRGILDEVMQTIGLPLLYIKGSQNYSALDVALLICGRH